MLPLRCEQEEKTTKMAANILFALAPALANKGLLD
jgi:hypothetical protein